MRHAMTVVIRPLYPLNGLLDALELTVAFFRSIIRELASLNTLRYVVVLPPDVTLEPRVLQFRRSTRELRNERVQRAAL